MRGVQVGCVLACSVPGAAAAQVVMGCDPVPPVTALIEPWEETAAALAEGAVRLAVLEGEEGARRLLVLTLPPPGDAPEAVPERRCRIVAEGGLGFADLDLGGLEAIEDEAAATLTARLPGLGFVPESTELLPLTLVLTFGVADGALVAAIERAGEAGSGGEGP